MKDDDAIGLLVLGGGAAVASALAWRSIRPAPATASTMRQVAPPGRALGANIASATWIHPVPNLGDRRAVISDGFRAVASATARQHLGADLMFRRRDTRDLISVYPPGSPNGSPLFFMPDGVPALAASAGVVTFAAMTPVGNTVIVQHPNRWATYYTHLAALAVTKGQTVTAGQVLGTIGASPKDPARLAHLHVELWKGGTRAGVIDPDPFLAAWSRVAIDWSPRPRVAVETTPRNGTMSAYRPVGARGERYPEWVQRLRGASGVYAIREIGGPIVYVGSSVRNLYETMTRHLQAWRRWKGYWRKHQFAEGADPGLTYERNSVEVAIKLTTPDDAHEEELHLIRRLRPRDNQLGQPEPELEEAPF